MWIFLGIVAFLVLLITAILHLPVYIIIKSDDSGELMIRYKFLHKTFGENPDPNNPILKTLKKASGISRLEAESLQLNVQKSGLLGTVSQTCRILIDLLKEVGKILKYCTAKRLSIKIICTGDDAAEAAINYGQCCTVIYPFAGLLSSIMKIRKKGQNINISCDYDGKQDIFKIDFLIMIRFYRVLAAFFRIALKEAKRTVKSNQELTPTQQKSQKHD